MLDLMFPMKGNLKLFGGIYFDDLEAGQEAFRRDAASGFGR